MRKLIFAVLLLVSGSAMAQNGFRLNGYANYIFDDRVDSYYSNNTYFDGKIKGGFQWGLGAQFLLSPFNSIELTYYNHNTSGVADYRSQSSGNIERGVNFDVVLNWIMLNGVRHLQKPGGKFEAWGSGGLGVCIINTTNEKTGNNANATKFAWQFRGGGTFWASERVGIKLNAQLQSAVQSVGGGFYIGTGGSGVGVSSYSSLLQFGLGGGIAVKLGGAATKPSAK
jgi:hypothetical protein